ncbi:MAG: LptF/LptG family permease [Planctomycetota bacterium]
MKLFDRYLARAALKGFLLVLLGLVVLISLAALVGELKDVGKGHYGLIDAVAHVGLTLPQRALDLMAVSALVGGILGLGSLSSQRELLMLRAFGQSPRRMLLSVGFGAVLLMLGSAAVMEQLAPLSSQEASRRKRIALGSDRAALTEEDLWLRNDNSIVRIGMVEESGELSDVQIFEFGDRQNLAAVIRAETATVEPDGTWTLSQVRRDDLDAKTQATLANLTFKGARDPANLDLLIARPAELSMRAISHELTKVQNSKAPAEAAARKRHESLERWFWRKLGGILLGGCMLMLALPFAVGSLNPASKGKRLIVGVIIGAMIHVAVQASHYGGEIGGYDSRVMGLLPAIMAFAAAIAMTWRLR